MWNLTDTPLKTKSFPISSSLLQVSSICYIQYLNKQNYDPPYTSLCQAQNFVGIFKYFIFLLKYFLSPSHPRGIKSCQVVPKVSLTLSPSTNGLFAIALGPVIIKTYQYSNSFLRDFFLFCTVTKINSKPKPHHTYHSTSQNNQWPSTTHKISCMNWFQQIFHVMFHMPPLL